ncbi:M48 family metalloprotease [Actinomadura rayongensis]|uniref:M48 family metalloprotease n=1 Tax=Actinomadura rayongensis TaxID=1429076 RepID=A0A6I4WC47_9ACTN|nr:M56 family metallopeptidase [Actinomadura rayongensis]MXQ65855.1 M48 family metalloprotease [Actinomadura rayongensis]
MDLEDVFPFVLPLLAAAPGVRLIERLPPRSAVWTTTALTTVLSLTGLAGLGLIAADGALRFHAVEVLGRLSPTGLDRIDRTGKPVGLAAAVAFGTALAAFVGSALREALSLRTAYRTAARTPGSREVVVVGDAEARAFTLPGRPGRIFVSTAMLDALDERQAQALLAHERGHLHDRHHLFRAWVRVLAAANPLLRPLRRSLQYSLERWADERAAVAVGDRRTVAHAIAKAALAVPRSPGRCGLAFVTLRRGSAVPRRVAALLAPPPRPHFGIVLVAAVCSGSAVFAVLNGAAGLHHILEAARAR